MVTVVISMLAAGCGGGGGGTELSEANSLLYITDWAGSVGAPVTGVSQKVSVINASGVVVSSTVLNRDTDNQQTRIQVPSAGCHLRVELNSAKDFAGTVTATTEGFAAAGTTFISAVGPAASLIALDPKPIVEMGKTVRLFPITTTTDARHAFVAPNAIEWSVAGTAATIGTDGTLTGVNLGSFKVTGKLKSTGASATSDASVVVSGAKKSKWTVMVFLNSANTLFNFAAPNIDQMERVASDDVRFVVQWKNAKKLYPGSQFDGTRRYLVTPNDQSGVGSELVQNMGDGVDMGKPETLKAFIQWTKANYPADRYAVLIWSHGNGWTYPGLSIPVRATSFDDEFVSAIRLWQFPTAFQGERFDIVGFDACLMQMMETASDLRPFADYIVGSEENTPAAGYPYDRVFSSFKSNPDAPTRQLAESFVTGHIGNPNYKNEAVTQSVIDTNGILNLESKVDGLAKALIAERSKLLTIVPEIRDTATRYGTPGDKLNYFDLFDISTRLKNSAAPDAVKSAAQAVLDAKSSAVVLSDASAYNKPFSFGLSIDFSPSTNSSLKNYSNLQLAKSTKWGGWLMVAP